MATADVPSLAIPGRVLGPVSKYAPGAGTHIFEGNVVSSLMGNVTVIPPAKAPGPAKRLNKLTAPAFDELSTITVARHGRKREILPDVNNIVLARVVRLMPKQAIVVIQQVGDTVLQTEWQGVIRVQDVRATEKDKVKISESFKPGDIVRAQVVRALLVPRSTRIETLVMLTRIYRFHWETKPIITSRRRQTISASSWRPARRATTWCPSAGRSLRMRRRAQASCARLPSRVEGLLDLYCR